jgi:hypothetical protein
MLWRQLLSGLFIVIAVGLGWFIAWLGTMPTITNIFDKLGPQGTVKQGQP